MIPVPPSVDSVVPVERTPLVARKGPVKDVAKVVVPGLTKFLAVRVLVPVT